MAFSVSEYLDRIEQVSLQIARDKLKTKDRSITLWLLLEGLRIDADGSFEWIQRPDAKSQSEPEGFAKCDYLQSNAYSQMVTQNLRDSLMCVETQMDLRQKINASTAQNLAQTFGALTVMGYPSAGFLTRNAMTNSFLNGW